MTKQAIIKAIKGCTKGFEYNGEPLKLYQLKLEDSENGGFTYIKFSVPMEWANNLHICKTFCNGSKKTDRDINIDILNHAITEKKIAIYSIA